MSNKRILKLGAVVVAVVLAVVLLSAVGSTVFEALLAMHGLR